MLGQQRLLHSEEVKINEGHGCPMMGSEHPICKHGGFMVFNGG